MSANYILLETITVGEAGASSVTFNNIPQSGYTDLKIVWSARNSSTNDYVALSVNGNSSAFTQKTLFGTGSAASSFTTPVQYVGHLDNTNLTANTFTNSEIYIPNYTSSNNKSYSADGAQENNGSGAQVNITAGLWSNTAPITSITLSPSGANFVQYSTFSLYGLAAVGTTPVIAPYASGGDIIQTDGTYWYHAFLSSGTFTPAKALSCDVLVVAGGGGGAPLGAGGGAGGLINYSSRTLTSNATYTVTVGSGGNGGTANSGVSGGNGSNSVFSGNGITTLTAIGGGGGGGWPSGPGNDGGSGGGADGNASTGNNFGAGTAGQGNNGGTGTGDAAHIDAGGGGGYSSAGGNASIGNGGTGGAGWTMDSGTQLVLSGMTVLASGGGGGSRNNPGNGGTGAGNGSNNNQVPSSSTSFGSGGGGSGQASGGGSWQAGSPGYRGVVVIRYAI